jgi:phytoene/squalene synthetase
MTKRFQTREEEIEALRQEPAFRALMNELQSQASERQQALEDWLSYEEESGGKIDE